MKKAYLFVSLCLFGAVNAQNVGINTINPAVTLDVSGLSTDATKADGVIAPRLSLAQLNAKNAAYSTAQTGAIVYVNNVAGVTITSTAQVESIGYYYFNGTIWKSLEPKAGSVIFTATLGAGQGSITAATISRSAFNTVPLPTVTKNLGGGTFSNNIYTVPVSGTYLIKSSIRLVDGSVARNIFQAVDIANADTPEGIWQTNYSLADGTRRWTMLYNRVAYFTKGQQLRLYIYSDLVDAALSDAALNITIISPN